MSEWSGPRYRLPRLVVMLAAGEPTMVELCQALGASRRSVEMDLNALADGGIAIERIQSSGGERRGRLPTRYRLAEVAGAWNGEALRNSRC